MTCKICGSGFSWVWTDTHGVAQCCTCGTPYRIYHYGDDNERIDAPPEMQVKEEWVPVLQAYWKENHRPMPGGHSFPGGQELASRDDIEAWNEWTEKNAEKYLQTA